jgi:hypothetical protein
MREMTVAHVHESDISVQRDAWGERGAPGGAVQAARPLMWSGPPLGDLGKATLIKMGRMEFNVLPGPSLPERARTALARATTATVSDASPPGGPADGPASNAARNVAAAGPVPVWAAWDGSPLLLPPDGSPLARLLAGRSSGAVRVSLPAGAPFSALRLTGTVTPASGACVAGVGGVAGVTGVARVTGVSAWLVSLGSVEFTGGGNPRVAVAEYRAARPDPLWRVAPGILHHLEHDHMSELVRCVRAHGMARAEAVIPRGLDRYGLELLVLTTDGIAAVRLSFPGGPVSSLGDVPASVRAALTCRCQAQPGPEPKYGRGHERGRG